MLGHNEQKLASAVRCLRRRRFLRRVLPVVGCAVCSLGVYAITRRGTIRVCEHSAAGQSPWRQQKLVLSGLEYVDFAWMRNRYGHLSIYAAESSRMSEDTTDARDGGLNEQQTALSDFLDQMESGRSDIRYNYLKLVDPYEHMRRNTGPVEGLDDLLPFGEALINVMRASLRSVGIEPPGKLAFSLWLGCKGSTTALHVDDQRFNVLLVLRGAKRIVTIDDADTSFQCYKPAHNRKACWAGVDVLSLPPPAGIAGLREVTLRAGEALLIPENTWHSVENLEPTIAVGINEVSGDVRGMEDCEGARFARLRPLARTRSEMT